MAEEKKQSAQQQNDVFYSLKHMLFVDRDKVKPNGYNPNHVLKQNMELLKQSILSNGFCFPIVIPLSTASTAGLSAARSRYAPSWAARYPLLSSTIKTRLTMWRAPLPLTEREVSTSLTLWRISCRACLKKVIRQRKLPRNSACRKRSFTDSPTCRERIS